MTFIAKVIPFSLTFSHEQSMHAFSNTAYKVILQSIWYSHFDFSSCLEVCFISEAQ